MTPTSHPSAEQLADVVDGVLPVPELAPVQAHVEACADCRRLRDALAEVRAALAAEGATVLTMPVDVAASAHAALRELVPPTHPVHSAPTPSPAEGHRRRHRAASWLAGAAAAVVLATAAVAGLQAVHPGAGDSSSDDAGSAASFGDSPGIPIGGAAGGGKAPRYTALAVSPDSLASAARQLAAQSPTRFSYDFGGGCPALAKSDSARLIRWRGRLAVLTVQPQTRTAIVSECSASARVLFSTRY